MATAGTWGVAARVWPIRGAVLLVLLAGVLATLIALLAPRAGRRPWLVAPEWLQIAAAGVAAVLALLNFLAPPAVPGATGSPIPGAILAGLAVTLLAAALGEIRLPSSTATAIALAGGALVVAGVALGLTLGDRALGQATILSVATTALTVAAVGASAVPGAVRLRIGGGGLSVGLAAVSAAFAWLLVGTFARSNFGLPDRVFLGVHLVGLVLVAIGAVLATRARPAASPEVGPDVAGPLASTR